MEHLVIHRERQEVTPDDLMHHQEWAQEAMDHVVRDALVPGRLFWGFPVAPASGSKTQVVVGNGRLYFDGGRWFNDTAGGELIDLNSKRPSLQQLIVSIVVYPELQETDDQERDFEVARANAAGVIDATTITYQPQNVKMERRRWAKIEAVAGAEAVQPQSYPVPANAVVVASILMDTTGIVTITRIDDNAVPNLADVDGRLGTAEGQLLDIVPRVATLASDLAKVDARTRDIPSKELLFQLAQETARNTRALKLPATAVNFRNNSFTDETLSDKTFPGYSAKIEEGLRFAPEAVDEKQLALFNQYNPLAKITAAGLMLPDYTEQVRRIVRGNAGFMSLVQYSYEARSLTNATLARTRTRYGAEFEQVLGSAFFTGGTFNPINQAASSFAKNGELFQVYATGQIDPDGLQIVRLSNYWYDDVTQPYWKRTPGTVTVNKTGYAWIETFVAPASGWCTGIYPKIYSKPLIGNLTIGLMKLDDGQPDFSNILAMVTLTPDQVPINATLGTGKIPIEPVFTTAGQRYGYFLLTDADYSVFVGDLRAGAGGTMFYGLDGGIFYPDPTRHIMFDLAYASHTQSQVSIDLNPLQLSGGIAAIDILADAYTPPGTFGFFEIQIGGAWIKLAEAPASALADLPPLVPLRYTMVGSADVMPGLRLSGSRCRVSRPKTTLDHIEIPLNLPAASNRVTVLTEVRNYIPAEHTVTARVRRGTGYTTIETADITTPTVLENGNTQIKQVFNLDASVTSERLEILATAVSAARLPVPVTTFAYADNA